MKLKAALFAVLVVAAGAVAWLFLRVGADGPAGPSAETFAYQGGASGGEEGLPVLWDVPAFDLPDQSGARVSPERLQGHVWVADFIFTRCTTVCPTLTAKMMLLQRRLSDPSIRFVSFSVDPDHDTPDVLAEYAREWNPDEMRWRLLSTRPDSLRDVARGMRVAVSKTEDPENPILHSSVFLLVDAESRVRGVYDSNDRRALDRLVVDARALVAEGGAHEDAVAEGAGGADGAALYADLGCGACHDPARVAPSLGGVLGREVRLEDGTTVTADAAYLRESILAPGRKVVRGYLNLMPSYEGHVDEAGLAALVGHVASLKPSADRAAAEEATIEKDPVCGMDVRVTDATPSFVHDGHTYHFCSEQCRDRFSRDPEAILARPGAHGMGEMGGMGGMDGMGGRADSNGDLR